MDGFVERLVGAENNFFGRGGYVSGKAESRHGLTADAGELLLRDLV